MKFTSLALLAGVLRTLQASGKAISLVDYVAEKKDGEVDGAQIASMF